ncbi:hypothetical protein FBEOM_12990 [Fusarium beomiforme]|uniref:Uncharacterized protein n=1 Tax=Fusarium beomiforme TaxID=44412 RepID=A0A9P5A7U5_9HYPO|nr:hypothetical protein FBEOM_12990 [Fusarium beomiforme]
MVDPIHPRPGEGTDRNANGDQGIHNDTTNNPQANTDTITPIPVARPIQKISNESVKARDREEAIEGLDLIVPDYGDDESMVEAGHHGNSRADALETFTAVTRAKVRAFMVKAYL